MTTSTGPLLQIKGLKTYFHTEGGIGRAVAGSPASACSSA